MPAIITHYCFGEDAMSAFPEVCGSSRAECDAFLLGNQGPDPLFFSPGRAPRGTAQLGRTMHREKPSELIAALKQAVDALEGSEADIGRAYAHGFLCHYLLDSSMHPLVYSTIKALCDAGVEGLTHDDESTVHTYIEREWDEMALTVKRNLTVADFRPAEILNTDPRAINAAQKLHSFMALATYGTMIDANAFARALSMYYLEQRALHSPRGLKRALVSKAEELVRTHSFVRSAAHRPVKVESTWLANPDNTTWIDPFTGAANTASFWDIYEATLQRIEPAVRMFDAPGFGVEQARELTAELNFRGEPTVAMLTVHEED